MTYNLNFTDIIIRYAIMMFIGILGGALHSIPLMVLSFPFFLSGILGWCPVFYVLNITHVKVSEHQNNKSNNSNIEHTQFG